MNHLNVNLNVFFNIYDLKTLLRRMYLKTKFLKTLSIILYLKFDYLKGNYCQVL